MSGFNIRLLAVLCSPAEQNDRNGPIPGEIHTIARTKIDLQFDYSATHTLQI